MSKIKISSLNIAHQSVKLLNVSENPFVKILSFTHSIGIILNSIISGKIEKSKSSIEDKSSSSIEIELFNHVSEEVAISDKVYVDSIIKEFLNQVKSLHDIFHGYLDEKTITIFEESILYYLNKMIGLLLRHNYGSIYKFEVEKAIENLCQQYNFEYKIEKSKSSPSKKSQIAIDIEIELS